MFRSETDSRGVKFQKKEEKYFKKYKKREKQRISAKKEKNTKISKPNFFRKFGIFFAKKLKNSKKGKIREKV